MLLTDTVNVKQGVYILIHGTLIFKDQARWPGVKKTSDSTLLNIENDLKNNVSPLDYKITISEIETVIKMAKLNESNFGPVSNEMLKCNPKAILPALTAVFNCILEFKVFRESWNLSLIKLLYKPGIAAKHANYRGICISSHLSKIFTGILNNRLEKWVESKHILPPSSLGFEKRS